MTYRITVLLRDHGDYVLEDMSEAKAVAFEEEMTRVKTASRKDPSARITIQTPGHRLPNLVLYADSILGYRVTKETQ